MNNLLLYDIHGTLLHSKNFLDDYEAQLTEYASEFFGKPVTINFDGLHGHTEKYNQRIIFERQGLDHDEKTLDRFFKFSGERYNPKLDSIQVIDHVSESLEILSSTNTLGLITGSNKLTALKCLTIGKLENYFHFGAFGNESYERSKLVNLAIERARSHGWTGDNVYVIGDTDRDVKAGNKAGVKTVGVLIGSGDKEKLRVSNPDHLIPDLSELIQILN